MAGRGNPSFLKNQKAQKRVARATAKRAERQARRAERAASRADTNAPTEDRVSAEPGTSELKEPSDEGET